MTDTELKSMVVIALVGVGTSLLAGKALRRLFLLPFEWIARKTSSKTIDVIVTEAERDLGIDTPTLGNLNAEEDEKNVTESKE